MGALGIGLAILATTLAFPTAAPAQATETVIHTFGDAPDGNQPWAGLIFDKAGNLYGTTSEGGAGFGTVYELSPVAGGGWQESILYAFQGKADGNRPFGGLVFDTAGNLYGTTFVGGKTYTETCHPYGCGVVFKLTPSAGRGWTESVLHTFQGIAGGVWPAGGLAIDAAGNLYGTTTDGGNPASPGGVILELSPSTSGWTYKVLRAFSGSDGSTPYDGVILDAKGNLYVATQRGGNLSGCNGFGCGTIFEMVRTPSGNFRGKVLYTFTGGNDGANPWGGLLLDAAGNLYGTAQYGGTDGCGTLFKLSPSSAGWSFNLVHSFIFQSADGTGPESSLALDARGNIYGTTMQGGSFGVGGVLFELSPGAGGVWDETILITFGGGSTQGEYPSAGVVFDSAGNAYGTTQWGGTGSGVVYELTP
jgi:uncharacterized repeat protein (TIGR03803 family)